MNVGSIKRGKVQIYFAFINQIIPHIGKKKIGITSCYKSMYKLFTKYIMFSILSIV